MAIHHLWLLHGGSALGPVAGLMPGDLIHADTRRHSLAKAALPGGLAQLRESAVRDVLVAEMTLPNPPDHSGTATPNHATVRTAALGPATGAVCCRNRLN